MKSQKITLTFSDYIHLQDLMKTARNIGFQPSVLVDELEAELNRAEVVTSSSVSCHVITMNTCAHLTDTTTGESSDWTLVFPCEADPDRGKLSVLSELGIALLGFSVGSTVDWESPEGRRRTRIERFSFQPEAAKQCDV